MKEEEYSGISIKQDSQKSSFNPIDIMRIEKRLYDTIQTVASSIDSDDALWSENEYYEIAYAFYNETVKDLNSLKSLAGADNSHYRKASFSVASVVAKFAQKLGAQHQNYNDLLVLIKTIDPEYKVADTVIEKSADYGENSKSKTSETITANGIKSIQKIKSENGIYKPADREELDILLDSLVSIKNIDISNVKDLSYLFSVSPCPSGIYKNHNLENANELKCWDVSHVENMSYMFCNRSDFTGYAVKNWNVKNVTNAEGIFDGCKSLNSIFLEKMAFSYDVKKASRFGNVNKYESPVDYFIKSEKDSFTKICKVCGEPLKPEEFFCSKCGHKVNNDVDSSKKESFKTNGNIHNKKRVSFGDALSNGFCKMFTFRGRASRAEYWWWFLFIYITNGVVGFILSQSDPYIIYKLNYRIISFVINTVLTLSVTIRRFKDINLNPVLLWLFIIFDFTIFNLT